MDEETKTTQENIDAIVNGIMARSAQFHARPGDSLADFFAKLRALLDHDVDNARENGLDVAALEEQGALNIGLARQTLADIAHNLADTEATRSARDNILAREAWPGRAELLKDYSEQLNKLELARLDTAVFVQRTIAQVRARQWEKMGAEYAIERVVAQVIRGTDGLDPEAKETLRRILQDPRKTDKFLAELRRAVDIKATVDGVDDKLADHDARTREQGAAINDVRNRLPPVLAKAEEADRHETNLARTFQKATAEWGLTERQKRILALHVQDKTAKAIGQDKEVRLKERQVRYELATINAVFLQKTGQSLSSRKRATREEVAEGAPWTGNVTQPDTLDDGADPDNLDRDGLDWDRDK